jgi:tetratricopeptide (TPR) repeat protein
MSARHDDLVREHGRHPVVDFYRTTLFPALCGLPAGPAVWDARYRVGLTAIQSHLGYGPVPEAVPWVEALMRDLRRAVFDPNSAANFDRKKQIRGELRSSLAAAARQLRYSHPEEALRAYELLDKDGALSGEDLDNYVALLQIGRHVTPAALHAYVRYQEAHPGRPDPAVQQLLTQAVQVDDAVPADKLRERLLLNQRLLLNADWIGVAAKNVGKAYLHMEDAARALPYFDDAQQHDDAGGEASFLLGQALFQTAEFNRATEAFSAAAEGGYNRSRIASWQAVALAKTGNYEKAFSFFEEALEQLGPAVTGEFYVQWGRTCFKKKLYEEAAARFNQAQQIDKQEWRAWTGLAITQMYLTSSPEAGRELLRNRISANGKVAPAAAAYLLGRMLTDQANVNEAIPYFRLARDANPGDPEYALALGIALHEAGDSGAAGPLELAARSGRGGAEVVRRLALLHMKPSRAVARGWLAKLAQLAPAAGVLDYVERDRIALAVELFNAGDFAAAATELRQLRGETSDSEWVRRLRASALALDAFTRLKRTAGDVWEQVAEADRLFPLPEVAFLKAFSAMVQAEFETAKSTLAELAQQNPDCSHYAVFHSLAKFLAGDQDAGEQLSAVHKGFANENMGSLVAFLEAHGAAGRGDHDGAAAKLIEWMKDPVAVRGLGLPRGQVNLFIVACFRLGREAIRPARAPGLLRNLNETYGDDFWRLAIALMHHYDAAGASPERADQSKIETCEAAYAEFLAKASDEELRAAEAHVLQWKLFLVKRLVLLGDPGTALDLLDGLGDDAQLNPAAGRLRKVLRDRLSKASHEKAWYLRWRDAKAAQQVWEELLRDNPNDLDAIHHLACLCWSEAHEAAAAGRYKESVPYWEQGLKCYRQLYSRSEYWDSLREKGRALCQGLGAFDETRFEHWRGGALRQRALALIDLIQEILVEQKDLGVEAGSRVMAIVYGSDLPDPLQQELSDELARRRLDPDATQIPERDLDESLGRARQVIDIDNKNVAARQFVIKAVAHFAQSNAGADDQTIRKCIKLLQAQKAHAEWLRANRQGFADQRESVERNLAAYYHGLGTCQHAMGQSEVRAGNRCFVEAKPLRERLDEAQRQGQDYVSKHVSELLATQDRHNSLIRQGQQHLDALKRYYQESDEALRRVLELDPINFEAKRLMDSHREEYERLS